jgi:hypothetical protein
MALFILQGNDQLQLEAWNSTGGGGTTPPVGGIETYSFSEVAPTVTKRQASLLDNRFPIASATSAQALVSNTVLTNTGGATGAKTVVGSAMRLTNGSGGLSICTLNAQPLGAFYCIKLVLSNYVVDATATYAELLVGAFARNSTLAGLCTGFSLMPANGSNSYVFSGGSALVTKANGNPQLSAGATQTLYAVVSGDYIRGLTEVAPRSFTFGGTTDLSGQGITPGSLSVLAGQNLGFAVRCDRPISVDVVSCEIAYFGGAGRADENPCMYEDGSNIIINNESYFTSSRKGWATAGFETADMSVIGLYSRNLTNGRVTSRGNIFVKRGSRVEGDFSAGLTCHRPEGRWIFSTPVFGHMKGLFNIGTQLQLEIATFTDSPFDKITVLDNPPQVTIAGEVPHDPTGIVKIGSYYYLGYGVQTGAIRPRLARSLDLVNWERVALDEANADAEGYKFFLYQSKLYLFASQQNADYIHYWLVEASGTTYRGTFANPLPQVQAQHAAWHLRPSDGAIVWGGMTTSAAARFPSTQDLYTNGDEWLGIALGLMSYYTTDSSLAGIGTVAQAGGSGGTLPVASISAHVSDGGSTYLTEVTVTFNQAQNTDTDVKLYATGEPGNPAAVRAFTVTVPANQTQVTSTGIYARSYTAGYTVTVGFDQGGTGYAVGNPSTATLPLPKNAKPVFSVVFTNGRTSGNNFLFDIVLTSPVAPFATMSPRYHFDFTSGSIDDANLPMEGGTTQYIAQDVSFPRSGADYLITLQLLANAADNYTIADPTLASITVPHA